LIKPVELEAFGASDSSRSAFGSSETKSFISFLIA